MTQQKYFAFEKLEIYHLSLDMAAAVYALSQSFPSDERFGLTSQLRRAFTSVTLNIAEGSGRETKKDFAHFLILARGSVYEVVAALQLATRLGYLQAQKTAGINEQAQSLSAKITAFARTLRAES